MSTKKVKLDLESLDGNAFMLLGAFRRAAKRQGWTEAEMNPVITKATSGDYDHLLCVLMDHCEDEE